MTHSPYAAGRWERGVVMVAAASLVLAACGGGGSEGKTLTGEVGLVDEIFTQFAGASCRSEALPDEVLVRDGKGELIGKATLSFGKWARQAGAKSRRSVIGDDRVVDMTCPSTFKVEDLPDVAFYVIEIEGLQEEVSYSKDELDDADWNISVAIER